jgi:cell division protein FtsX
MLPNNLPEFVQEKEKQEEELEFQQIAGVWKFIDTVLTIILLLVVFFVIANSRYHWLY